MTLMSQHVIESSFPEVPSFTKPLPCNDATSFELNSFCFRIRNERSTASIQIVAVVKPRCDLRLLCWVTERRTCSWSVGWIENIPDCPVTGGCRLCPVVTADETSCDAQTASRRKDGKHCQFIAALKHNNKRFATKTSLPKVSWQEGRVAAL